MSDIYAKISSFQTTFNTIVGDPVYAAIDLHTCGEPLRVILSGVPTLEGNSILQKRNSLKLHHDGIRKLLMYEPRGHRDMYGCILVEPDSPEADFGIIFMHNEGYSTMCGHAVIAITRLAVELGWKEPVGNRITLKIDAPCGLIISEIDLSSKDDFPIKFQGVPSFVLLHNQSVILPDYGVVNYDIAYGGAFYAYVDADEIALQLHAENVAEIVRVGRELKKSIMATSAALITHPKEEELSFLYGVIFRSKAMAGDCDFLNVCVFADGEVDRSPTGSGICGKLALLKYKQLIDRQQDIVVGSIIHTKFKGTVVSDTLYEGVEAVVPLVAGNAFITGQHYFYLDIADPLREGFLIG